jgi:hypothetical protein
VWYYRCCHLTTQVSFLRESKLNSQNYLLKVWNLISKEWDCQEIRLLVQSHLSNVKRLSKKQSISSAESAHLEIGNLRGTALCRNSGRQSSQHVRVIDKCGVLEEEEGVAKRAGASPLDLTDHQLQPRKTGGQPWRYCSVESNVRNVLRTCGAFREERRDTCCMIRT